MKALANLHLKLRIEEFLAILLFLPMVLFMVIYHDKEGFRQSDIHRLYGTIGVFIVFLLIIKLKDLELLQHNTFGHFIAKFLHFLREILPFGFCMAIYTNMHDMVHLVNPNDIDNLLIKIDELILGTQPAFILESIISPKLTDYMYFSYSMFFIYPVLLPTILFIKGNYDAFRKILLSVILTFYIGYIGYVIFPAVGPKYTLAHLFEKTLEGGVISNNISFALDYNISHFTRRDCFPSLHNAVTLLTLLFAFKYQRKLAWVFLPLAISLFVSTLYLRYHYFIDMLVGFALAIVMFYAGPRIDSWWRFKQKQLFNKKAFTKM